MVQSLNSASEIDQRVAQKNSFYYTFKRSKFFLCRSKLHLPVWGCGLLQDTGFKENAYLGFNLGSQIFQWNFIAPEVGYEYHTGVVRDNNELHPEDPNARPPSKLSSRFSSHTFSVAPKIVIGKQEAALVIIPQYNIGSLKARGDLLEDTGREYVLADRQEVTNDISFWSFAAGIEGDFFDLELLHFSLLLKYHLLNSKNPLRQIDFVNSDLRSTGGSKDGLGISFRVYFKFLQLLKSEKQKTSD